MGGSGDKTLQALTCWSYPLAWHGIEEIKGKFCLVFVLTELSLDNIKTEWEFKPEIESLDWTCCSYRSTRASIELFTTWILFKLMTACSGQSAVTSLNQHNTRERKVNFPIDYHRLAWVFVYIFIRKPESIQLHSIFMFSFGNDFTFCFGLSHWMSQYELIAKPKAIGIAAHFIIIDLFSYGSIVELN